MRDYVGRYETIAITRDPMDRAISMFVSKFVRGYGRAMTRFENLEPFAKHTYLAATGVSAERVGVRYTGLTFLDFLRFVRERVICRSDEPNLNHHWNAQTPFTWPVEMFEAISFFDVREFRRAIQHLNARVGIQFEPPVANPTPYGSEQLAGADKVNSVDLAVLNDVPAHASFVTPESSALVAETYAIDYERLGYSPPI